MAEPIPIRPRRIRLEDRLEQARERRFVGRSAHLDLFREALSAPDPQVALLYLYGPGGIGKTALIDAFGRIAVRQGVRVLRFDGRSIDPSPAFFLQALRSELELPDSLDPLECLDTGERTVLLLDTYELLAPLDAWLRESFLPDLPDRVLTVIAGRNPPAPGWRTDPGWSAMIRILPLRNLDPAESEAFLRIRSIPPDQHEAVLGFTHGHPLALSLVADLLAQGNEETTPPRIDDPDVIRVLLDRFVQGVPGELHRRALQVCAHARVTTEALLAEVLGNEQAGELFQWLRALSFIEQGPDGLFPHDLARDVLDSDLRWRNPGRYQEDHRQIRNVIVRALQSSHGLELQRASFDLLFLHRHNPLLKPYVEWSALGTSWAETATPADYPAIMEMVRGHEGNESAEIARYWLDRQPEAFTVFRAAGDRVIGFIASLALFEFPPEISAADPALASVRDYVARFGPLRPGETILLHRFAMGRDSYQEASPVWNMVIMTSTAQWLTTPRLAWSLLTIADYSYWQPTLNYINFQRAEDADFIVGGRHYGSFTHDWRTEPPIAWLDLMAERELNTSLTSHDVEAPPPAPLVVLAEPRFRDAVRQALRDINHPVRLAANPLVRSALVRERADESGADGAAALRALVQEAAATLTINPKDRRFYRAIERGYFAPAATQELAAESLDLPFSTYRLHLTTATQRISDWLWQREIEIGLSNHPGG